MAAFALVVARFYDELAARLEAGARGVLVEAGEDVEVFAVEGAFELAPAASYVLETRRFAGVVCLGAVIRGETDHYEHVCAATAYGIEKLAIESGIPVTFGVLTVDNYEQALARSGGDKRDSGAHAAHAVLALARLRSQLLGLS
jgi:6,7-dimethyl-8-ribityllumazine synthase